MGHKGFQESIFIGVPAVAQFASRLQEQKARFNPYMVACNSIGYFTPSDLHF
jgi:ribosome biogenesis protein Tsr3